ncbi:DEAD/DEAH box helicase family protein [Corynebacterium doosanense]|uniref:DEAD/DEAH box helicase family protein n=1 Tax=Corynebacterium doosanense TaxID=1121358 RepID=UPI0003AA0734|nr:DEAD/DEAH box helicase family protein [Corynebacterium doosanense]
MAFKIPPRVDRAADTPEDLYRPLSKGGRAPGPLWSQQTDILREWYGEHRKASDVALELPTGAGKTLVGGLIGEWLRIKNQEKVAYVCPNNQLAKQVHEALDDYGIDSILLTGPVSSWTSIEKAKYDRADAMAVSSYSHIFNTNPALGGSGTIIFDDAHSGGSIAGSLWTLAVQRDESTYFALLNALAHGLSAAAVGSLRRTSGEASSFEDVHLVPPMTILQNIDTIASILEEHVQNCDTSARHTLSMLRNKLTSCMFYIGYDAIEIRPVVPPTKFHNAFSEARRRIYMSATIGSAGELERNFGITGVSRLKTPKGWETTGSGRRLFIFPGLSQDSVDNPSAVFKWTSTTIEDEGVAAILAPSEVKARQLEKQLEIPEHFERITGSKLEEDPTLKALKEDHYFILTNRYDGVDFPDDECRLLILSGLPRGSNMQERFLLESIVAGPALSGNVRAKVVQGVGRATRNDRDFSVVIILGDALTRFVADRDNYRTFSEELQAEIEFGVDNSELGFSELAQNISSFLTQDPDWAGANAHITEDVESKSRVLPAGTRELATSADDEVLAANALWAGDLNAALKHAGQAISRASHTERLSRYFSLWHFLCSQWSLMLAIEARKVNNIQDSDTLFRSHSHHLEEARKKSSGSTWLRELNIRSSNIHLAKGGVSLIDGLASSNLYRLLKGWGLNEDRELGETIANLNRVSYKEFENALAALGKFLGASHFEAAGGRSSYPDAMWLFDELGLICWEAKSEASDSSEVSVNYAREAESHLRIAKKKFGLVSLPDESFTGYVTPQTRIAYNARPVLSDSVFHVPLLVPHELALRAQSAIESFGEIAEVATVDDLTARLDLYSCLPSQWIPELKMQSLNAIPD